MDYYHITSVIEDSDASDNEKEESKKINMEQSFENPHEVLKTCLSNNTVEDIMKEYSKNTVPQNNNNICDNSNTKCISPMPSSDGVILRRKPNRSSSYSHRASQRFSRLLEGVTSITSLVSRPGFTKEDTTETPTSASAPVTPGQDLEEEAGPTSLPYWVEASQNIYKEDCESPSPVTDESGYASIAETASMTSVSSSNSSSLQTDSVRMRRNKRKQLMRESIATADMEEIEEKISEIFESMNLEANEKGEGSEEKTESRENIKLRRQTPQGGDRRKKTVSGYFHDWATWMGSVEGRTEAQRSTSLSTDLVTEVTEEQGEEEHDPDADLWSTWDKILVKWNTGVVTKSSDVKDLVRRGIPGHVRGMAWQMLSGANNCEEKTRYLEFLETESACEKMILRDIARTYPEHDMFKKKMGQESLFNVMKAYSVLDREVGYCQGTAFIVGLLLMMMPEEEAFSVLVMMMGQYGMRDMFKPSMTELGLCIYQLDTLIESHLPDLHMHLQSQAIHTNLFASRWFLTLFTSCVSVSLSSRIMDCFLCEGREVIFRLALTLLSEAKYELLQKDIEGVTKYFQHEMPAKFEEDQDKIFLNAFNLNINEKMMRRIEKEYLTMRSKKTEDEMEIKRLRTENSLLRQKMDSLEQESSDLADRLIQDQVTKAEEQERLVLSQEDLETARLENQSLSEELNVINSKCDNLQQELKEMNKRLGDSYRAREDAEKQIKLKSKENEILKNKCKELLNNQALNGDIDADLRTVLLDEEAQRIKAENKETKKELKAMKHKVSELKQMWKAQLCRQNPGPLSSEPRGVSSGPKKLLSSLLDGSAGSDLTRLEEELVTCRLAEVDTLSRLQECQARLREMEHQSKSSRLHLSRQDAFVIKLQDEIEQQKRKQLELQAQLRESEIKMVNMEEELVTCRLAEVDTLSRLQECQARLREMEHQSKSSRLHLSRQDAFVIKLQDEIEQQKRKQLELQAQLRESEIKMVNMEGKWKDERLMSRIAEAENSQLVAELRQQIASLECQSQELVTLDNLDSLHDIEDNSDDGEEDESSFKSSSRVIRNCQ